MALASYRLPYLAAALAGLAIACQAPRPATPPSGTALKIMPLGDSMTKGFDVPGGYRVPLWQALRERGYRVDFVGSLHDGPRDFPESEHEGHSGWKIEQIRRRAPGWLAAAQPETILLLIGTNDVMQGDRLATAPERLAALLETIYAELPEVRVFVASIPPFADPALDAQAQAYNAALPALVQHQQAAGRAVVWVDIYSALTKDDLADGVHPNQRGYERIAATWLEALLAVD